MKRALLMIAAIILSLTCSGCSSIDAVGQSQELLSEYVAQYNANNIQGDMALIHSSLVEELGGAENLEIILTARRSILGEITDYEITNTSFETVNKMTEVVLTLSVDYENAPDAEDTYTFLTIDDGLYISGVNLEKEPLEADMITSYYTNYADPAARKQLYIPYGESLIDDEYFELASEKVEALAGGFVNYEIISKEYAVIPSSECDAVCYLIYKLKLNFENMSFVSDMQISEENGVFGINYEYMLPEQISNFCDTYREAISMMDQDTLLSLYNADFFGVFTEYSQEGWWDAFYMLLSDYGVIQDFELVEWDWDTVDISGVQTDCFILYTQSEHDSASIQEKIIISAEDGLVVGHYAQEA